MEETDIDSELPGFPSGEKFRFACGPDVPCFNRCCAQLNLPLTPYDVLCLSRNLGITASDFLRAFTGRRREPETGFQMFHLRMIESPDAPCPFVTPAGCSVYEDRPGACRSYPLGRGARLSRDGVAERYFLIREEHCCGFDAGPERTSAEWFNDQGMERHNYFNDRYMRLMSMVAASGRPLEDRLSGMATLCLWEVDKFRQFLRQMNVLAKVAIPQQRKMLILEDSATAYEACLDFGIDWLELLIFGKARGLSAA